MPDQLRFLVAESEPPQARETRRESVGRSSGETYIDTLRFLAPGAVCHRVKPADRGAALPDRAELQSYDAMFDVPAENLTTQGYGEQYLKINTQDPERQNRRVTVRRITPLLRNEARR